MSEERPEQPRENQEPDLIEGQEGEKSALRKTSIALGSLIFVVLVASIFAYADYRADEYAGKFVDEMILEITDNGNSVASIEVGDVDASIASQKITVSDVLIYERGGEKSKGVNIDAVVITAVDFQQGKRLPSIGGISVRNLTFLDKDMIAQLEADTGIDYSDREIFASARYIANQDSIHVYAGVSVEGASSFEIDVILRDTEEAWSLIQKAYIASSKGDELSSEQKQKISLEAGKASVVLFEANYENYGEIENFLKEIAEENGQTVEETKTQLLSAVDQGLGKTKAADEVKKFLENPKKLTLSVHPDMPVKLREIPVMAVGFAMGRHEAVLAALNAEIVAN